MRHATLMRGIPIISAILLYAMSALSQSSPPFSSLRDDCVGVHVEARVVQMDQRSRRDLFAAAKEKLSGPLAVSYYSDIEELPVGEEDEAGGEEEGWRHPDGGILQVWKLSMDASAAEFPMLKELVHLYSTQPFGKWDITVTVSWRKPLYLLAKEKIAEPVRPTGAELESHREKALKAAVVPSEKATMGDALQTIADGLLIPVLVGPELTAKHKNDWRALLDSPLGLDGEHAIDALTMEQLITHVADRLGGTADLSTETTDWLAFNGPEAGKMWRKWIPSRPIDSASDPGEQGDAEEPDEDKPGEQDDPR